MGGARGTRKPGRKAVSAARPSPSPEQLFAAVVDLVSAGGSTFKGTARRYSLCVADAEDAYQRSLEILMTKAPTEERAELRPWLHTVIKHEALALRRHRERLVGGAEAALDANAEPHSSPEDGATERQRALQTAEALGQLKSSEVQCMLLKALGYSYEEISARTGFSWTKVNRSLTEGRKRFFDRFAQIESGQRCEGFRPLLSAACDGEASSEDERQLATHLRGCQSCRAAVRAYRTAPTRLAELLPPAVFAPLLVQKASWWSRVYESMVAGTGDRAGALGHKLQQAGEMMSAQKATAVVASTAAIAGGAAVPRNDSHERPHRQPSAATRELASKAVTGADPTPPLSPPPAASPPAPEAGVGDSGKREDEDQSPAAEFIPEPAVTAAAAIPPRPADEAAPAPAARTSAPISAGRATEFGP